MAKAKKKPAKKPAKSGELELPVSYSNVSIGQKTCRVGITIHRGNIKIAEADRYFCDKRLSGTILARAGGAQAEQNSLPSMEAADYTLEGVFDVKGYGVTAKHISCGLTFALESIDVETFSHFAKGDGMVTIEGAEAIPDEPEEENDDEVPK